MTDYYEILGISHDATNDDIKKAYRKMSRKYHPDIAGPEFEDKFKEVNTAYEVLSDSEKRAMVDQGIDPLDPASSAGYGSAGSYDDLFASMFGGAFGSSMRSGPLSRVQPGRDALASMTVELKTAVFGGQESLTAQLFVICDSCTGSGSADGSQPVTCPECHGAGQVQRTVRSLLGTMMTAQPCSRCEGFGTIIQNPCASCMGHGRVRKQRNITVSVPAGVHDGTRIRLSGQGEVGEGGGPAGDLYIDVSVKKHDVFSRENDDLHCWIHVPMTWAILGHTTHIETFDGEETINIPEGSQPDDTIVLNGLGVQHLGRDTRGNLIVHIEVSIPKKLSNQEKKLIRDFEELNRESHLDSKPEQKSQPNKNNKGFFEKLRHAFS